jgi:hypothetical protein
LVVIGADAWERRPLPFQTADIVAAMRIRLATVIAVMVAIGAGVTIAYGRPGPPYSVGDAEVRGTFAMRGVITDAVNVAGERPGEQVRRTWHVHPTGCVASACDRLQVVRNRGTVRNSYVVLRRVAPGSYQGSGVFWVGLRCLGRRYSLGSRAPYTIALQVTQRRLIGSVWYATRVHASYTNLSRTDGTPCPLDGASDAARYSGRLSSRLPAPPVTTTTTTPTETTTTETTTTGTGTSTTSTETTTTGTITTP